MATTPTKNHPKSEIPQLSYDCRRRIHLAQMVALYSYIQCFADDSQSINFCIPFILSYIHDDIEAIDNELISLGLFDEAMGNPQK
ncbi:UNVERIFIED_CONTAM: hypothetical protein DQE83_22110 [Escherichia coli]